ncbi:MAG: reprolysin-like metallopeptidase, partial [Tepidisphaeraceae bacterium]
MRQDKHKQGGLHLRAERGSAQARSTLHLSRLASHLAEPLEARRMLAAATGPVVRPLLDLPAAHGGMGPATTTLYGRVQSIPASARGAAEAVAAKAVAPFTLNAAAIRAALAAAPLEFAAGADADAVILPLPTPDGTLSRFRVVEAPVMEAALAAQFPDIKTYRGIGIDDPTASLRLDYTPLGFHAQVLSVGGSYYIDPYHRNDAGGTYASYYKRDAIGRDAWTCEVVDDVLLARTPKASAESDMYEASLDRIFADSLSIEAAAVTFGTQLKTYRAAVAANGEYTAAVGGGTVAGGQAAVVTAMNRVNGVYETDLAIRMVLVANNSSVIYTNAATDPYSNSSSDINVNTSNLNSVIGSANYDIGHVFTTGSGGVAFLGSVGKSNKGGGTTGLPSPTGDGFWIDYVAHEMGHQFGGNHTFNTSSDSNRSAAHAYEPGSGSTIMGYAGITGAEDLQANSDPYFHSESIDEIRAYIGTIPAVGTTSSTGNTAPTVSAGPARTIPTGTPFSLTATGSDVDGDVITYDWQQRDLGAATLLTTADNGASPLFRAWAPTTSPTRTLPRLAAILLGTNQTLNTAGRPVEKLFNVARTSTWRVIARDNRVGGGGVASSDLTLTVVNTGSAFSVTAPNTAVSWGVGTGQTVSWNIAGTTGSGINTANVNILLSTDGGNTFPIALASGTPNDGSQAIVIPAGTTTGTARIKIEAVGNIFFDISNTNFTITGPPPPSTISGQVFEDRNANGVINAGENGINLRTVFLDSDNDGVLDGGEPSVVTPASGNFSFTNLAAGTYHLRELLDADVVATSPAGGAIDIAVSGSNVVQNIGNFFVVYGGTGGNDNWEVRATPGASTPWTDDFNRATLDGIYDYTTTVTAGDGGASIAGSDTL